MKIGIVFGDGLIPQGKLNDENLRFAKQLGATDIILHLPDADILPSTKQGYWTYDDLHRLSQYTAGFGLRLAGIENFPILHWHHVLLAGPERDRQIKSLKRSLINMGRAGISLMGYYFSLAGVWGRSYDKYARGDAYSDGFVLQEASQSEAKFPGRELWGMQTDELSDIEDIGFVSKDEVWSRLDFFLKQMVPVAEDAGVRLAAHPDDPPIKMLRNTHRILTRPDDFDTLLNLYPSYYNAIEFCQGTISYMSEGNLYNAIEKYASGNHIAYVHLRNNRGRFPSYYETFIDDGEWDILNCLKLYSKNGFDGVIVPDHTPQVNCGAPYHAGFAHAIGFIKAGLLSI